ncbi:MAG TPA: endo-1,3-alpha-glucanase family glycosylhydrolase [Anaerolineales bacterium]|nr:endo-1,3-alpha-glucanase family glycosylhydrolase [Anaerolineales bacterium]
MPITNTPDNSVPVLAYYYIWFDPQSWDRAKKDYPLLGRYSSDDADVMRRHIEWAKAAGIDGFIVSWKSTEKLNRRLDQLVKIAEEENFKLAINYESLDFDRNPLPPEQLDADLNYFVQHYADNSVFDLFEKPMVIWAGTWEFSLDEIKSVTQTKRNNLLILASEKNMEGYQRLSEFVDGDAYYWSSVNPDSHSSYLDKLTAMGETIHQNGGMWIAPAAPGFDARLVGGTSVVERKNGQTLKTELNTALQSLPDAIGLISWNEFSENSHIEPSQTFGNLYLKVLAQTRLVTPTPNN